jgi:hypothetical protein
VNLRPSCCYVWPRFKPKPVVARTAADILAAKGVKPTLSPNLEVLATVEALGPEVKRLLFIGVGCQVKGRPEVGKVLLREGLEGVGKGLRAVVRQVEIELLLCGSGA